MVDTFEFEAPLQERLRAHAALASRPFDAVAIAHEAIAAGTHRRVLGKLEWPSTRPIFAWVVVGLLLALALLGTVALAGAMLPRVPPHLPQGASGGWIAFGYGSPGTRGGDSDIYVVKEGTAERRIIGSGNDGLRQVCPTFSPDGTRLAYSERPATDNGGNSTVPGAVVIVTLDAAGLPVGPGLRLPVPASSYGDVCPKWAPDGQSIAFLANGQEPQLWIGHLDGTETQVIAGSPPVGYEGFPGAFDWSPHGTALVVIGGLGTSLRVVPLDGGQPRLLASGGPSGDFASPRWSPDGTRIAVMAGSSVEIYRADGSASPLDLPSGSSPAWSPDGQVLAYVRRTTPLTGIAADLVILSPDGAAPRVVVSDPGGIRGVVWSPDGTRLVYADLAGNVPTGALVSVSAVGDADPIVLTQRLYDLEDADSNNLSWQPVFP
jgi:dipeptidyl aminopeptidase/acylaminoacyl peptidase